MRTQLKPSENEMKACRMAIWQAISNDHEGALNHLMRAAQSAATPDDILVFNAACEAVQHCIWIRAQWNDIPPV